MFHGGEDAGLLLYMTRNTRTLFFYSCIALFAILAPLLIAYSFGYIFHPTTGLLEKTGGIFIKSKTPRISIFVDGTFIKETSYLSGGALLTDITPGTHRLRLEKSNYHSWSKTIVVEPMLVADFRNVLLVHDPAPIATSTKDEIAMLRASINTGSLRAAPPKETVSLSDFSAPAASPSFFLNSKHNLIGKTATTTQVLVSYVNSFSIVDGVPYFIDKNGFLGKVDPETKHITTIGRPGFYLSQAPAQFLKAPNGKIVILDASGGLFLSDGSTNIQTITGGVRQFSFDSNGVKMLIQKDQSVDVLWLEDNPLQPFEQAGIREQIFADESIIQDADWFFGDDAHIVIRNPDGIFFTDIDTRDGKNIIQLFEKKTDELVTVPAIPQSIFFRKGNIFHTISI